VLVREKDSGLNDREYGGGGSLVKDGTFWYWGGDMSPLGHGVASIPIRVLYSHAGPVGTAEDLLSQTTKSSDHVKDQVI
jgi:hypothetical protein